MSTAPPRRPHGHASTPSPRRAPDAPATAAPLNLLFFVEGITSLGTTLLMVGIFFYTKHRYGWGLRENFLLAVGQGAVYVAGSLLASRLTRLLGGRRTALATVYAAMALVAAAPLIVTSPVGVTLILLAFSAVSALGWPALESLVATGADPAGLSRRIGVYNFVWSATGALAVAINGALIDYFRPGVFLIPAIAHATSAILIFTATRRGSAAAADSEAPAAPPHAAPHPEPDLAAMRTLALWLSRLALPATYVALYSLTALMPYLPVMGRLESTTAQTLLSSVWLVARTATFVLLGATVWWHARPRLLFAAAVLMLLSFLGCVASPSTLAGGPAPLALDVLSMALWQILLGAALGMIYAGSLYFGMVLSEGSTEHGGYHEALIGLGSVLGPGAGAAAQLLWPGNLAAGVAAVTIVLAASVAAAGTCVLQDALRRGRCRAGGTRGSCGE